MKKLAVLAPMTVELKPVVKALHLLRVRGHDGGGYAGTVGTTEVLARLAGMGTGPATDATEATITTFRPDHVVVVGIAGGLASSSVGDLLVPASATLRVTGISYHATRLGPIEPSGRLVTGDGLTPKDELDRWAEDGYAAVDMESAAVAAVCEAHGVPWTAFRGISDLASDDLFDEGTFAMVGPDGKTRPGAVVRNVVRRPSLVPKMAKLARGTKEAMTVATSALVDALG